LWRLIVFFSFASARMPGSLLSFFWHFRQAGRRSPSSYYFFFNTLSALVSTFFLSEALSLPACSICEARAFAFRACAASGIGYLRSSGNPKSPFGSAFFLDVVSFAMFLSPGR
jgi:hypothetical protein